MHFVYLPSLLPFCSSHKFWRSTSELEDFPLDPCRNYCVWGFASVLSDESIWILLDVKN